MVILMLDANRLSEVKCKNFVDGCVNHFEEIEMYLVLGNAVRLFFDEKLCDGLSRGLSFVMEMSDGPDTMCLPKKESCFKWTWFQVESYRGVEHVLLNRGQQTKSHVKNFVMIVPRSLKKKKKKEIHSVKAICSKKVGRISEEYIAMKFDEHAK